MTPVGRSERGEPDLAPPSGHDLTRGLDPDDGDVQRDALARLAAIETPHGAQLGRPGDRRAASAIVRGQQLQVRSNDAVHGLSPTPLAPGCGVPEPHVLSGAGQQIPVFGGLPLDAVEVLQDGEGDLPLVLAREQAVLLLQRNRNLEAEFARRRDEQLELLPGEVGQPDVVDLSCAHGGVEEAKGFLRWRQRVPRMQLVEIDSIATQLSQGLVEQALQAAA